MTLETIRVMLPLPACSAKVLETLEVSAKVRPNYTSTHRAEIVLKIRVNLDLLYYKETSALVIDKSV